MIVGPIYTPSLKSLFYDKKISYGWKYRRKELLYAFLTHTIILFCGIRDCPWLPKRVRSRKFFCIYCDVGYQNVGLDRLYILTGCLWFFLSWGLKGLYGVCILLKPQRRVGQNTCFDIFEIQNKLSRVFKMQNTFYTRIKSF